MQVLMLVCLLQLVIIMIMIMIIVFFPKKSTCFVSFSKPSFFVLSLSLSLSLSLYLGEIENQKPTQKWSNPANHCHDSFLLCSSQPIFYLTNMGRSIETFPNWTPTACPIHQLFFVLENLGLRVNVGKHRCNQQPVANLINILHS